MLRYFTIACTLALATMLTACNNKDEKKSPSQVLARVDGEEITVNQLNYLISRQASGTAPKQQMLDALIEQQLLIKKAEEMKLDRDPVVLQAIEQAKRNVLAQAAAERIIGKPPEPDAKEISEFYASHPALFSARKVYDFAAFTVQANSMNDAIKKQLDTAKTPAETKAILEAAKIEFQASNVRQTAEQLPLDQLQSISAMNPGDIAMLGDSGKVAMLQLVHAETAPIDESRAKGFIKSFLENQHAQQNSRSKLDALKKDAKIEYLEKFDEAKSGAVAPAPAASEAKSTTSDDHMKAGVKGLQ